MMISFFNFQKTYNYWLRERYRDDLATHPDFDPDLWMEVGSSSGTDQNQVYGLSNIWLRTCVGSHNVLTVRSSQLVSSDYRQILNNSAKWLWTWDHIWVIHMHPFFGRMVPGTTSLLLLLLLQLRHCSSLIFFFETY